MTLDITRKAWRNMHTRCKYYINEHSEKNYRLRGISVCDRWQKFDNFLTDMGKKPKGMQLDRVDNNKGYGPDNCRWVSATENTLNRRPYGKIPWKGIHRNGKSKYWTVKITVNYKQRHVGVFMDLDDAAMAYNKACILYRGFDTYGNCHELNKTERCLMGEL